MQKKRRMPSTSSEKSFERKCLLALDFSKSQSSRNAGNFLSFPIYLLGVLSSSKGTECLHCCRSHKDVAICRCCLRQEELIEELQLQPINQSQIFVYFFDVPSN